MELIYFFIALGVLGALATAWAHYDTYKQNKKEANAV